MNEYNNMDEMFADTTTIELQTNKSESLNEIQIDDDVEALPGVSEEEHEEVVPEPVPVVVKTSPTVQAPKTSLVVDTVFYGSKGKQLEDEAFVEQIKSYFSDLIKELDWFDDFIVFLMQIEDEEKKQIINRITKDNIRNNESMQYEFIMRYSTPFYLYRLKAISNNIVLGVEKSIKGYGSETKTLLVNNFNQLSKVINAMNGAEKASLESIKLSGKNEIEKIQVYLDKIIEREVHSSKGRVNELKAEVDRLVQKINEIEASSKADLDSAKKSVLKNVKQNIEDVLGASSDKIADEFIESLKKKTANTWKNALYYAGCAFAGVWLFAIVAKHFPSIVF